jgi:hypothetical protein
MKAATGSFRIEPAEQTPADNHEKGESGLMRYALVVILVAIMFLLSSWNPDDVTSSVHLGSGFVWFWLIGGLTTLFLIFIAAKKSD